MDRPLTSSELDELRRHKVQQSVPLNTDEIALLGLNERGVWHTQVDPTSLASARRQLHRMLAETRPVLPEKSAEPPRSVYTRAEVDARNRALIKAAAKWVLKALRPRDERIEKLETFQKEFLAKEADRVANAKLLEEIAELRKTVSEMGAIFK